MQKIDLNDKFNYEEIEKQNENLFRNDDDLNQDRVK